MKNELSFISTVGAAMDLYGQAFVLFESALNYLEEGKFNEAKQTRIFAEAIQQHAERVYLSSEEYI